MRKLFFAVIIVILALFLSTGNVSAADSTNITVDNVISASSVVKSYIETNHTLPNTVNVAGNQISMSQFLELLTTALLNINNGLNTTITLKNYDNAPTPSENITVRNISKVEYLDIANRVKSYMDINGKAPNYATQTSTGSTISFESLVYMYSKILNYYKTNNALPNYVSVAPWKDISVANGANVIGSASYGYVTKEVYGNQSSNQTIVLIVGVHPEENGIHTAVANALSGKSVNLSKKYVIYKVHVTKDASDYTKGRMNGQLLAQQFVVPNVPKENPILAVDIHENHGANSGYEYYRFLYPISNTAITTTYANEIISQMPFLVIYTPPNHTSPEYVTVPIAEKGIPTIIYETYLSDSAAKKASDASMFIEALDSKVGSTSTVNTAPTANASPKGGLYNNDKVITLSMNKAGNIYYTTDGTTPTNESILYTGPITLTSTSTTTLKFIAVDTDGKSSPVYTETYTIDEIVPILITTSPKNGAIGFSRTAAITFRFSENIKTGANWSKIYMKNANTGKTVVITKSISGNTLSIKMTLNRYAYNQYLVYIPVSAVQDSAGNNLAAAYMLGFKTGK